jgi:hypothetical protein
LTKTVHLFTPPDAYQTVNQQPEGMRFDAHAVFNGENRPYGALITYVANKPEEKKEAKPVEKDTKAKPATKKEKEPEVAAEKKDEKPKVKYDSVTVEIFDSTGERIRLLKQKAPENNGVNRMTWAMNEKGVRGPSREASRANAPEPGGNLVLPGVYKVRLTFGGQKDSTTIHVKGDPRFESSNANTIERYKLSKEIQKLTVLAAQATERLRESRDVADDYEKKLKALKRDDLKDAIDKSKAIKDSIAVVMDFILGKEDKRQGITSQKDPTPVSFINRAQNYINSSLNPVSETDRRVVKHAEEKIDAVLKRVNVFYEKTWPAYRASMEKTTFSPFKDYTPLRLR